MTTRGLITVAKGHPRYLEMAVDLALSAREHSELPFALAADGILSERARRRYPAVFDAVVEIPPRFLVRRAVKYAVPEVSPWSTGLFVDADCWIVSSPDFMLDEIESAPEPVRVYGEFVVDPHNAEVHHGFPVAMLMERFGAARYLKCNSGVFAFRKADALPAMRVAFDLYRDRLLPELRGGRLGDELAIGLTGDESGMGLFDPPGPMFWRAELLALELEAPKKPVVHMIGPIRREAFRRLLRSSILRRRSAGVPVVGNAHWRWKQRRAHWNVGTARIGRFLLPLTRILGIHGSR